VRAGANINLRIEFPEPAHNHAHVKAAAAATASAPSSGARARHDLVWFSQIVLNLVRGKNKNRCRMEGDHSMIPFAHAGCCKIPKRLSTFSQPYIYPHFQNLAQAGITP